MRFAEFDGLPFFPSQFWAYPTGSRLEEVGGDLRRPNGPAKLVRDLKHWAIDPQRSERMLDFSGEALKVRKLSHERAAGIFLENIVLHAGIDDRHQLWLLLPAIADDERRRAYRALLKRSIEAVLGKDAPIHFLFEPEMALEFFRLINGELELDANENNLFLIVDCGALTCNMTVAISTRGNEITTGKSGTSRRALQSVPGDSINRAGRYVDERLWREACAALGLSYEEQSGRLQLAERAKIEVARSERPFSVRSPERVDPWVLTPEHLREMSAHLWDIYRPSLQALLQRTFEQLNESDEHRSTLARRNILDGHGLARALRGVVLAGGTSQLPGFAAALRRLLGLSDQVPFFRVEDEYPVVAAVGGLAHVLKRQGLLVGAEEQGDESDRHGELVNALQDDVYLAWRERKAKELRYERLFARLDWPLAYMHDVERSLDEWAGKLIEYSLVWGPSGASKGEFVGNRAASKWNTLDCTKQQRPVLRIRAQEGGDWLSLRFFPKSGRDGLYYLNPVRTPEVEGRPERPRNGGQRRIRATASQDVVIDFGMSKTLVVFADGPEEIDPEQLRTIAGQISKLPLPPGWRIEPTGRAVVELGSSEPDVNSEPQGAAQPLPAPVEQEPEVPDAVMQAEPQAEAEREDPDQGIDVGSPEEAPQPSAPQLTPNIEPTADLPLTPELPAPERGEAEFVRLAAESGREMGLSVRDEDLAFIHLACKVRPFILLAGPSGAGKTTLARLYAHALGCSAADKTFVKVNVQAHWIDDGALFAPKHLGGLCEQLTKDSTGLGVALLDEMNLARPEFYLTRWLLALDDDAGHAIDAEVVLPRTVTGAPRIVTIGTLNIDEWSRPPGDKILDRAFLIEPELDEETGSGVVRWSPLSSRVSAEQWARWTTLAEPLPALPPELEDLVAKLRLHDSQHARSIHESMQPSRRALHDVRKLLGFWERVEGNQALLARSDLLDRAVAARIVPKFRGDARAWSKLLNDLKSFFHDCQWRRCARHLEIMDRQREEGFVSFWG